MFVPLSVIRYCCIKLLEIFCEQIMPLLYRNIHLWSLLCILSVNQFSAIFIQVKNLSSSPSDADVEGLTAALKLFLVWEASLSARWWCLSVPARKKIRAEAQKKNWSVGSDDMLTVAFTLFWAVYLAPCSRFIPPAVQRILRSTALFRKWRQSYGGACDSRCRRNEHHMLLKSFYRCASIFLKEQDHAIFLIPKIELGDSNIFLIF